MRRVRNSPSRRVAGLSVASWIVLWGVGFGVICAAPSAAEDSSPAAESAEPAVAEPSEDDILELLSRANAGLASEESYPESIALYRRIIELEPTHREAGLRLAQVLSWSGNLPEALAEYARLRAIYPRDLEIQVNQAEALSWSGAVDPAFESFSDILSRDEGNARAARGAARSLLWAGRKPEAYRAYVRALELEDDPEARREWDELRKTLRPRLDVETNMFSDSSDYDRRDLWMRYSGFQDMSTRIGVRLGYVQISHPQNLVAASVRSPYDDDTGIDLGVILDRTLDSGPKLTFEIGGRQWSEAGLAPYLRAYLERTSQTLGSLSLSLVHEGYGDVSNSFEAVQEEVQQTAVAASLYRQLSARFGAFGRIDLASLDDGNSRHSLYTSLAYQPWVTRDATVSMGLAVQSFSDDSDSYYAPESDGGLDLTWHHRVPLGPAWLFRYRATVGFQSTKERGQSESGTLLSGETEIRWEREPWTARLRFGVSYSQRSSRYNTRRALFEITREF